jgi:plastocyanin
MFFSAASLLSLLVIGASAKIHDVQVGGPNGTLVFSPEAIFADVGDQVVFHFNPKVSHPLTSPMIDFAPTCI